MSDHSDSDSDLEIVHGDGDGGDGLGGGQVAPLLTASIPRRPPPSFTYSRKALTSTPAPAQLHLDADSSFDFGDADSDDDELAMMPKSSGTVREDGGDQNSLDHFKSDNALEAAAAAADTSADITLSQVQIDAFQEPSARQPQPPTFKLEVVADHDETQPASQEPGLESGSQADVFGLFFNATQSFDSEQHGRHADIDIVGKPASSLAPIRLEDDGDETRVEGDYGFERLRRDQEQARLADEDGFNMLPTLPEPSLDADPGSTEDDVVRAMEKQQLILQVERQRANAQADERPRLMHLNRDGMFTQTEPSQFLDDTQSQLFSQDSDGEQQRRVSQFRSPAPALASIRDVDEFSEDSDVDGPSASAPRKAATPLPLSQSLKRKLGHDLSSSSSPLTSIPTSDDHELVPLKRKRKSGPRIVDSEDEEEGSRSSPSPRKVVKQIVVSDDEEDVAGSVRGESPEPGSADEEGGDADAEMSDNASEGGGKEEEEDYRLDLKTAPYRRETSVDWNDTSFSDQDDDEARREQAQREPSKNLVQSALSNFFGVPPPPAGTISNAIQKTADQTRKEKNAFIQGEAEESDEDDALIGKRRRKGGLAGIFSGDEASDDEGEEDEEDDGKDIAELVDDEQDENQAEKDQLVAEKFHQDREEQDKADEELHTRATKGLLRKARPGMGLENELDDDAQDDLDRRRITQGPQKRKVNGEKDGLDDIQNTALAQVYKADIRNDTAEDADFLAPLESESDSELEVFSDHEDGNEPLSAAAVRAELLARAREQRKAGRKGRAVVVSDDEVEGEGQAQGRQGPKTGSDEEDDVYNLRQRGVQFRNRVQMVKIPSLAAGADGVAFANGGFTFTAGPGSGPRTSGSGSAGGGGGRTLMLREEDDDDKSAMDLVLGARVRNEAELAKLRRAASELGERDADRRRFFGVHGGAGGAAAGSAKQNTSSITQFGSGSRRGGPAGGGGSAGVAGTTAIMKTGFHSSSSRRAAGGGGGGGGGSGSSSHGGRGSGMPASRLAGLFDSARSLKFREESQ